MAILIIGIISFFALIAIIGLLASPKGKGIIGEYKVNKKITDILSLTDILLNNVMLYNVTNNRSVQVDHILISKKGLFVIETKNYSGRIYGDDFSSEWTQVLNYGQVKNKFHSPVKQNNGHIYVINKLLNNQYKLHNVVIFTSANISNVNSNYTYTMGEFMILYNNKKDELSLDDVNRVSEIIQDSQRSDITIREHKKNIQKMKEQIDNNICPNCGGKIVLKNGKYGEFYGCSNFPKCKFIKR